ncbi:MAG: hypothetical protein ACLT8E_08005 [Akkermansia sp.]
MGRKALITVAAALFTVSIPVICLSQEVFGIICWAVFSRAPAPVL